MIARTLCVLLTRAWERKRRDGWMRWRQSVEEMKRRQGKKREREEELKARHTIF